MQSNLKSRKKTKQNKQKIKKACEESVTYYSCKRAKFKAEITR